MKGTSKGPPPACLTDWLALANDNWQPSYGVFSGPPKQGTHDALLSEQRYVCVYCGCGLKTDRSDSHIEHFWPQSSFNEDSPPDLTLDFNNLFVSCGPNKHSPDHPDRRPLICGEAKADWFSEIEHVYPADADCEQRFKYGLGGFIYPETTDDTSASQMISVLNLNDATLVYERRVLLYGIESDIAAGKITPANKMTDVAFFRAPDGHGRLLGFGHVAARYLEDEL